MDHKFNVRTRITSKTYHEPIEKGIDIASYLHVRKPVMDKDGLNVSWLLRTIHTEILSIVEDIQ